MARYTDKSRDSRRIFWSKMEDRFWNEFLIKMLRKRGQGDMGDLYVLVYIRLTTYTANSNFIYRKRFRGDIETEIAAGIDFRADLVKDAIEAFCELGLAEMSEDRSTLVLTCVDVGVSVGAETEQTRRKREREQALQSANQGAEEEEAAAEAADDGKKYQECGKKYQENGNTDGKKYQESGKNYPKRREEKKRVEPEKSYFPDDDDDLPFADISDEERIQQGLVQVANKWNSIVKVLKGEGIQASSLVLSRTEATSDRSRKLRLAIRDYGADVVVRCLKAYERDDWWTGRTTKPEYAGKARNIEYVLDNFGKLLRLADEMGLIEAADASGGVRYRPADTSPVQIQQTAAEEPKETILLSLCPKGYTGPRIIVNGIEKPAGLKQ